MLIESSIRVVLAAGGVWLLLWLRPRAGRFAAATPGAVLPSAIAIVLALVAGELVLRQVQSRPVGWLVPEEEPRRRSDFPRRPDRPDTGAVHCGQCSRTGTFTASWPLRRATGRGRRCS